jgi:hypothetical protein
MQRAIEHSRKGGGNKIRIEDRGQDTEEEQDYPEEGENAYDHDQEC